MATTLLGVLIRHGDLADTSQVIPIIQLLRKHIHWISKKVTVHALKLKNESIIYRVSMGEA